MILPHLKERNIILGSGSPRRKLLLEGLNISFTAKTMGVEEVYDDALHREEIPRFLSELKASAFEAHLNAEDILITSDTTVFLNDTILNKPTSEKDATNMLQTLSGETHTVITAVTLTDLQKCVTFHDETLVTFKELSEDEINYYVKEFSPMDKAGAYGAQEFMGYIAIEKLEGSYFNVMGLPVHKLYEELKNW